MRRGFSAFTLLLLPVIFCLPSAAALAQPSSHPDRNQGPRPITAAMEQRVDGMVHKLTLAQKIALIGGEDSMFIRSEPSIGFPRLKMSDGPMGVRTWGPSTAYAAGIGLAASWDTSLAEKIGVGTRRGRASAGSEFSAGTGRRYLSRAHEWTQFRVFWRRPLSGGKDRRELYRRRTEPGRKRDGQAFRAERLRV